MEDKVGCKKTENGFTCTGKDFICKKCNESKELKTLKDITCRCGEPDCMASKATIRKEAVKWIKEMPSNYEMAKNYWAGRFNLTEEDLE